MKRWDVVLLASVIRVDMIWTLKQVLVRHTLGSVGNAVRGEIMARVRRLLPD